MSVSETRSPDIAPVEDDAMTAEPVAAPRRPARSDLRPLFILLVGVVGLVPCIPVAPLAWTLGSMHEQSCRAAQRPPDPIAVAGRLLGQGMTLFLVSCLVISSAVIAYRTIAVQ